MLSVALLAWHAPSALHLTARTRNTDELFAQPCSATRECIHPGVQRRVSKFGPQSYRQYSERVLQTSLLLGSWVRWAGFLQRHCSGLYHRTAAYRSPGRWEWLLVDLVLLVKKRRINKSIKVRLQNPSFLLKEGAAHVFDAATPINANILVWLGDVCAA
jgi:hypothetical protein